MIEASELDRLKQYKNRQVVVNFYEDEILTDREGLHFEWLEIQGNHLVFLKGKTVAFKVKWDDYDEFVVMGVFKNYYTLRKAQKVVEIYFP